MVLPSPHTHPRERTLAAMLLESRRPPTGLPSELKLLLRKLANAIAQGASEIVLPPGYAATERSFLQADLRPRSFPETCHPVETRANSLQRLKTGKHFGAPRTSGTPLMKR
jgi:hypothetical protein